MCGWNLAGLTSPSRDPGTENYPLAYAIHTDAKWQCRSDAGHPSDIPGCRGALTSLLQAPQHVAGLHGEGQWHRDECQGAACACLRTQLRQRQELRYWPKPLAPCTLHAPLSVSNWALPVPQG